MEIYEVEDVNAAIKLAKEFKKNKRYDLFRGQINDWPILSTFGRLNTEDRKEGVDKSARLQKWMLNTPGLEEIACDADKVIAVGQHYGLPTNFIDFTTSPSVAGFFASHGKSEVDKRSCIICIDKSDVASYFKYFTSSKASPEFLELSVENLWRLEAQKGSFLFCPVDGFEMIYDFDRIVFPFKGEITGINVDDIYPPDKSKLEILLEQYFMNEYRSKNNIAIDMSKIKRVHIALENDRCDKRFVHSSVSIHHSWEKSKLDAWLDVPEEKFVFNNYTADLNLAHLTGEPISSELIKKELTKFFSSYSLDKQLRVYVKNKGVQEQQLSLIITQLWNGLRSLPCDFSSIVESLANCIILFVHKNITVGHQKDAEIFRTVFKDVVEVEYGSDDSSYSRGYISKDAILKCVRSDIHEYLNEEYKPLSDNITTLLQAVSSTSRLFDYVKFSNIFVEQLVPCQMVFRFNPSQAIFYSPARISALGLP